MNVFNSKALAEATRLTREGRLQEATALLIDPGAGASGRANARTAT